MSPDQIAKLPGLFNTRAEIIWEVLPKYFKKFKPVIRVRGRDDKRIRASLSDPKQACILQVNGGSHWVVPIRGTWVSPGYLADDPWTGRQCSVIEDYRNITGSEHFIAN